MSELKEELKNPGAKDPGANGSGDGGKEAAAAAADDARKAREAAEASEKRAKELEEENAKLKRDKAFEDLSARYPHAKDHRAEIEEKTKSGMSLDDAATLVLHKANKLKTADEMRSEESAARPNMGGSADLPLNPKDRKNPKDMTQEERRAELMRLEKSGDLKYTPT